MTEHEKSREMTAAFFALEREYLESKCAAENACAKTVHRANLDLPSYSKARLYDILKQA